MKENMSKFHAVDVLEFPEFLALSRIRQKQKFSLFFMHLEQECTILDAPYGPLVPGSYSPG